MATVLADRISAPAPSPVARAGARPPALAVIVPTFNERGNVDELVARVGRALAGIDWELILVDDDSPDGTAERARIIGRRDSRVRVMRRIGRRGLASACIEGLSSTNAPLLAVMDGDLQHDPAVLGEMYDRIRTSGVDLVVASRNVPGGDHGGWARSRSVISRVAAHLGGSRGIGLSDPMSGFFMLRRDLFERHVRGLSGAGFKILLDLVLTAKRPLAICEVPLRFSPRGSGASKLDAAAVWQYLVMLAHRRTGGLVPTRLIAFGSIGLLGLAVHLMVVGALVAMHAATFPVAQTIATAAAIMFNYGMNDLLGFADRRHKGRRWPIGLLVFALLCSVGAIFNIATADFLFFNHCPPLPAAAIGTIVGATWNYGASARCAWPAG